jgi:hypothetical protein
MDRGFDFRKCQTVAASPAEPGELPFWFRLDRGEVDFCGGAKGANTMVDMSAVAGLMTSLRSIVEITKAMNDVQDAT